MIQLLLWTIIAYGMSNIVVYGKIFNKPRNLIRKWGENDNLPFSDFGKFITEMMSCMMCFSFHGGWFLSFTIYSPTYEILDITQWISWFFDGMFASGAVWAINAIVEWFEENRPNNKQ
jgi:hypothetical protein